MASREPGVVSAATEQLQQQTTAQGRKAREREVNGIGPSVLEMFFWYCSYCICFCARQSQLLLSLAFHFPLGLLSPSVSGCTCQPQHMPSFATLLNGKYVNVWSEQKQNVPEPTTLPLLLS